MTTQEDSQNDKETSLTPNETLLYHYTSLESFLGMTDSGTMWATHIRYLNDTSEQRLMWELVRARIEARLQDSSGDLRDRLLAWKAVAAVPQDEDIYVISFSQDGGDRLSQWRGYGANSGISIGFNRRDLEQQCTKFTTEAFNPPTSTGAAHLLSVKYVSDSGDEQTNRIIDIFLDRSPNDLSTGMYTAQQAFSRAISFFSASLKHVAFKDEQEYRIIIFDFEASQTARYRARKSLLSPYIEFDIRDVEPSIIIVGPSPNKEISVAALKHMLSARDSKDTEVIATQMPYRDW
jgi:hypothetical protein